MIENIIGWSMIATVPFLILFALHKYRKNKIEQAQRREKALAQLREEREASWRRLRERSATPMQTQVVSNNSVGVQSAGTATYNSTSASSGGFDLATMILLNEALNSRTGSVQASVDYDTNSMTVTEEPAKSTTSWSSDDDSPSKSSGWSSSSDSSSSWDSSSSNDVGSSSSWD